MISSNEVLAKIKERIKELEKQWTDEPIKNDNHMASMILGEIDGLMWVWEITTGKEYPDE
jgi:hypothetical protein